MWCERIWIFVKRHATVPGAVVVFALAYILMLAVNAGEVGASWVQAIGSIAAIGAAAYLPLWHLERAERKRQSTLRGILRVLIENTLDKLWLLTNNFLDPLREKAWMLEYLRNHRDADLYAITIALDQIPIADLTPEDALRLGALREAVSFGVKTIGCLTGWIEEGYSDPEVVQTLRVKRSLLSLARAGLYSADQQMPERPHVEHGIKREQKIVQPEPLHHRGVRVYRRFCCREDEIAKGLPPYAVVIQIVTPWAPPHSVSMERNEYGWTTSHELDEMIVSMADRMINSWEHDPR